MKMMGRFFFFILASLFLSLHGVGQESAKYRIDPSRAYGGMVKDYVEELEYIPLESTKESLLGAISNLVITDSSFIIYDFDTKSILFFSLAGKYFKKVKIDNKQYPIFSTNKANKLVDIYLFNTVNNSVFIKTFSLTGKLIIEKLITKNDIQAEKAMQYRLQGNRYALFGNCFSPSPLSLGKDSVNLVTIFEDDKPIKSFLPIVARDNPAFCTIGLGSGSITPIDGDSALLYCKFLDHTLYKVTADTVMLMGQFIFPEQNSLSSKIAESKNLKEVDSLLNHLRINSRYIFGVQNIRKVNNKIIFNTMYRNPTFTSGSSNNQQFNFIYHLDSRRLVSFERLTPDAISYYLPITDGGFTSTQGIILYDNTWYSTVSSLKMFAARDATKSKNIQYSAILQKYFKTQSRKSNPIIVKIKLKES